MFLIIDNGPILTSSRAHRALEDDETGDQ